MKPWSQAKFVVFWTVVMILALVAFAVRGEEPLPTVPFSTSPWKHNMFQPGPGQPDTKVWYSGTLLLHPQQYGLYAVDVAQVPESVRSRMLSGVRPQKPNVQPGATTCNGDYVQSVNVVIASASVPKWAITVGQGGSYQPCSPLPPDRVWVYRTDGTAGLRRIGPLPLAPWAGGDGNMIDGDTAYIRKSPFNPPTWYQVNLNTMTWDEVSVSFGSIQTDIAGFTYTITKQSDTNFTAIRIGDAGPTPTPTSTPTAGTPTQTPTFGATNTPTRTPTGPQPINTPTPSRTWTPTLTATAPAASPTPSPTNVPPTSTPSVTSTPALTVTPTNTPHIGPIATPTKCPTGKFLQPLCTPTPKKPDLTPIGTPGVTPGVTPVSPTPTSPTPSGRGWIGAVIAGLVVLVAAIVAWLMRAK